MPDILTISTQKPINPALDYQELRKIGIEHLEKVASSIWTDYNIHDPGITTLEFLCYALTDLSYRTEYSIPDLLATPLDTAKNIQQHFITAKNILPNKAVTINDYRKLLIDIEKIKNAWISLDTKTIYADLINQELSHTQPNSRQWEKVTLKGYYKVLLEFEIDVADEEKESIKQQARNVIINNRNLCEDFTSINEVDKEEFRLCSEIEVSPEADPIELLSQVFFNIQLHLSPSVKFYRLSELLVQGYTSDRIFEGPLLTHGFIKDEELAASELKKTINLSDVMRQVLAVTGVSNIMEVQFNAIDKNENTGNQHKNWIINVSPGKQPVINIRESRVVLYKEGMPFRPDSEQIKKRFDQLIAAFIAANESITVEDISFDTGTYRHISDYYSIQEHYPKTYGISHWGLPEDASTERKLQAKQLQGYLYFFDQQLSNYLSQLSNINQLFSADPDVQQTYFTQVADGFKDAHELFSFPIEVVKANIQQAAENPETFAQRRNMFLDHLLSRFAESFSDYVNILHSVFPSTNQKELINTKVRFLKNYPEYSSQRFTAFNFLAESQWDTQNISGLEKRLQSLLGFSNIKRRTLVNLYSEIKRHEEIDTEEFHFELIDNRSGETILISAENFPSAETAERELSLALILARDPAMFNIGETSDSLPYRVELKDAAGKLLAMMPNPFSARAEAISNLSNLQGLIENRTEEGMFLLEHLLLVPDDKPVASPPEPSGHQGFMPICVDPNCEDCDTDDPYSFRISIVLPAYAKRFFNMDFRRYCERIIRMETPAHLFPKICWVNNEQLQEFENAYKDWLEVKSGKIDDVDKNTLQRLVNILTHLKTVYPPARLQDCTSLEERQLFLLNQNALGTLK